MARRADHWEAAELTGLSRARAKSADSHHTSTPSKGTSAALCLGMLPEGMVSLPTEKESVFSGLFMDYLLSYFFNLWFACVGYLCM